MFFISILQMVKLKLEKKLKRLCHNLNVALFLLSVLLISYSAEIH